MAVTDTVSDNSLVTMFIAVHKIVRDSFLPSIAVINPVDTLVCNVIEFSVFNVFMNNWVILLFVSTFLKCLERRFLLDL